MEGWRCERNWWRVIGRDFHNLVQGARKCNEYNVDLFQESKQERINRTYRKQREKRKENEIKNEKNLEPSNKLVKIIPRSNWSTWIPSATFQPKVLSLSPLCNTGCSFLSFDFFLSQLFSLSLSIFSLQFSLYPSRKRTDEDKDCEIVFEDRNRRGEKKTKKKVMRKRKRKEKKRNSRRKRIEMKVLTV